MFGSIDCAGILKLRNADIELRKGETDIGRKNTRVRLVFRVHIPESNGRIISLQAASNPIECCKYPLRFAPSVSCNSDGLVPLLQAGAEGRTPRCSDRQIQGAVLCSCCTTCLCATIWATCTSYLDALSFLKRALMAGGSSWCLELVRTVRDFRVFAKFIC